MSVRPWYKAAGSSTDINHPVIIKLSLLDDSKHTLPKCNNVNPFAFYKTDKAKVLGIKDIDHVDIDGAISVYNTDFSYHVNKVCSTTMFDDHTNTEGIYFFSSFLAAVFRSGYYINKDDYDALLQETDFPSKNRGYAYTEQQVKTMCDDKCYIRELHTNKGELHCTYSYKNGEYNIIRQTNVNNIDM